MSEFVLKKSMTRELTNEEALEVRKFIREHEEMPLEDIAAHFEAQFKMPVTLACINRQALLVAFDQGQRTPPAPARVPARKTFSLILPLTESQRECIIRHLAAQRVSTTESDMEHNGQDAELENIHRHGREGLEDQSDASLLSYVCGEVVDDLGFVKGAEYWVESFGFKPNQVIRSFEGLFWLNATYSGSPVRCYDEGRKAWSTIPVCDLFAYPKTVLTKMLKVGVAHVPAS